MPPRKSPKQSKSTVDLKGRTAQEDCSSGSATKKPFDKRQWREQKYSHKAKKQRFEEQRRKNVMHKYRKELRKSKVSVKDQSVEDCNNAHPSSSGPKWKQRQNPFTLAKQELEQKIQEKELQRQKVKKDIEDRKAALERYRQEKTRRYKILSRKTKKGQPVMAGRMQLLLEKIQKMVD